jgi:hypothetical protein
MAYGALEDLTKAMACRARGEKVLETRELRREADYLTAAIKSDSWVFGPAGSKNTPVIAAAALALWLVIAKMCEREATQGLFGLEHGAPTGFYFGEPITAKMLTLRELLILGKQAEALQVARALRAAWAWDALTAFPVGRLRDRVLIADRERTSETPALCNGLTVAVAGNRWTPRDRDGADIGPTSEDAHSALSAAALDWQPRAGRAKQFKGALAAILGVHDYTASTPAALWGLTDEERTILTRVVQGDVAAAREASTWIFGCKPARPPADPDPWRFRLRRTTEGVESIFFGPWPNPNKPARAATQVLADGSWIGLQPSHNKDDPAQGYHVELRDGQIVASSDQSNGAHSIPELGGALLWQVDVVGLDVSFTGGVA